MMLDISFLLLLISESFSGFECSQKTFDELAQEAVCTVKCDSPGNIDECKRTCIKYRPNITTLDVGAEANVRLVCRDDDHVVLGFDSGVFIGDHREEIGDWKSELIDGQFTASYVIESSSRYQWRFTRAFANGISRPETTEWITALTPGVKPTKVTKVWVRCLDQEEATLDGPATTVRAEIAFQPPEDRCCRYVVTSRQNKGTYDRTIIIDIGKGRETIDPIFADLDLGESFTVSVEPRGSRINGDSTAMNFATPSIWKPGGPPRICVPEKVEGLVATVFHDMGNTFDLHVTWFRPVWLPDFFIAETTSRGAGTTYRVFHNLSGTATETVFRGMELSRRFNVSIRAWSMLGGGQETSKRFAIPERITDSPDTDENPVDQTPLINIQKEAPSQFTLEKMITTKESE